MPHLDMNPAAIFGSIAAVISTVLALIFGAPFLIHGAPQTPMSSDGHINIGSSDRGSHSKVDKTVTLPKDAAQADKEKTEKLLRTGLWGITYPGIKVSLSDVPEGYDGVLEVKPGFPFFVGGFDGCNSVNGNARINADGTLEYADSTMISTTVGCDFGPRTTHYDRIVRTGMQVYTAGNRIFFKNGDDVLEFGTAEPEHLNNGSTAIGSSTAQ